MRTPICRSEKCRAEVVHVPEARELHLSLVGTIDEDTNFVCIRDYIFRLDSVIDLLKVDLGAVDRINSIGILHWREFLQRVHSRKKVRFLRVPNIFLEQSGLINLFLAQSPDQFESLQLNYLCGTCKTESQKILLIADYAKSRVFPPENPRCECGGNLQFADSTELYIQFFAEEVSL